MNFNPLIGCWRLEKFSLWNAHYAFVDSEEYLADQLFVQHRVRVHFGAEYSSPEHKYRIIMCSCRKKDVPLFEEALQELPNKMLLLGHTDYIEFSENLKERFKKSLGSKSKRAEKRKI